MDTRRRLKAAEAPVGAFLGDMTNFIAGAAVPTDYLLGLLNSRLLNWRFKITSTNNYLSAAEIEALPIPRIPGERMTEEIDSSVRLEFENLQCARDYSVFEYIHEVKRLLKHVGEKQAKLPLGLMVQRIVQAIRAEPQSTAQRSVTGLWDLLDAVVVLLYEVEGHVSALEGDFPLES